MKALLKRDVYPIATKFEKDKQKGLDEVKIIKTVQNISIAVGQDDKYKYHQKAYVIDWKGHELICEPNDLVFE